MSLAKLDRQLARSKARLNRALLALDSLVHRGDLHGERGHLRACYTTHTKRKRLEKVTNELRAEIARILEARRQEAVVQFAERGTGVFPISGFGHPGYLYGMATADRPGEVKVGASGKEPMLRAKRLSRHPGVFAPYRLLFAMRVVNTRRAEHCAHTYLANCRVHPRREFFRIGGGQALVELLNSTDVSEEVIDLWYPRTTGSRLRDMKGEN